MRDNFVSFTLNKGIKKYWVWIIFMVNVYECYWVTFVDTNRVIVEFDYRKDAEPL